MDTDGYDIRTDPVCNVHVRAGLERLILALAQTTSDAMVLIQPTCGSWVSCLNIRILLWVQGDVLDMSKRCMLATGVTGTRW